MLTGLDVQAFAEWCDAASLVRFAAQHYRYPLGEALRMALESRSIAVRCFTSAEAFMESLDELRPRCVVSDVRMPGWSGIELQQALKARDATLPLILITGHGDIPMAVEAMQHGAFDFLQKPFRDQDLITRVQKALELDGQNRGELKEASLIRERFESLTPREREVFQLVTDGKANKVMAGDLGVSQRTVEIHRARVMEKMGAKSLAQLVRMSLDLAKSNGAS